MFLHRALTVVKQLLLYICSSTGEMHNQRSSISHLSVFPLVDAVFCDDWMTLCKALCTTVSPLQSAYVAIDQTPVSAGRICSQTPAAFKFRQFQMTERSKADAEEDWTSSPHVLHS